MVGLTLMHFASLPLRDIPPLFKWLASYADMAEFLHDEIPRDARVLVVGCGNSSLSADMYDDGYRQETIPTNKYRLWISGWYVVL